MRTAAAVMAGLAACDLVAVGLLAAVVWSESRRFGRPATRPALALAVVGLLGLALLYGAVWLLLSG
ncbi:MAG: hypothetical protein U0871_05115 [Gemmataceae bacterium]